MNMVQWWGSKRGREWKFSHSQMRMFGRCRAAWELSYVQRVERSSHPAGKFGTAVHAIIAKAFEEWLKGGVFHSMNSEDFAPGADGLSRALIEEGVPGDRDSVRKTERLLEALCDADGHKFDPARTYGVETKFVMDLEGLPVPVLGYIDRVDKSPVRVIDYKTGRTPEGLVVVDGVAEMTPAELLEDPDTADVGHQLQVYALVASVLFPDAEEIPVQVWYLQSATRIEAVVSRDEIEALEEKYAEEGLTILKEREFPYTLGKHCGLCDVRQSCPEFHKADLLAKPGGGG